VARWHRYDARAEMLILAHGYKELPPQLYRANVSQPVRPSENFPHISQECPPMAALCDSVVSLQTSNLRPRRSNLPIVSGGCPENSARDRRRLETRVRSHYLAGMVVARCRFLLRGQYSG
jgi:hypothetical protein